MIGQRTAPLLPADVNNEIWRLIKRCDEVIREIYKAGDEYAEAKGNYEDAHAQALLKTDGTVQEKKATADRECFPLYKTFLKADLRYKYLKLVLETGARSTLSRAKCWIEHERRMGNTKAIQNLAEAKEGEEISWEDLQVTAEADHSLQPL